MELEFASTLPWRDIIHRESPALATTSWFPLITATTAVLPAVGPENVEWVPCIHSPKPHDQHWLQLEHVSYCLQDPPIFIKLVASKLSHVAFSLLVRLVTQWKYCHLEQMDDHMLLFSMLVFEICKDKPTDPSAATTSSTSSHKWCLENNKHVKT